MPKLYIIDGHSYIHRAYHALPPLTTSRGEQVNVVYGFIRMLLKILRQQKPDYIAICFDTPGPTFRDKKFAAYKATRKPADEELKSQIPLVKEITKGFNLTAVEKEGYEADDIIAALALRAKNKNIDVIIVSGDKDMLQLVDDRIKVLNEQKNILFDRNKVFEKYGIYPENLSDMFALSGDKIDNIPGVAGIGEKTAVKLLQEYGSLDEIIKKVDKVRSAEKDLLLSKELVTLDINVPLGIDIEDCIVREPDVEKLREIAGRLEFTGLLKEFTGEKETQPVDYKTIINKDEFEKFLDRLKDVSEIAVSIEVQSNDKNIVGISISFKPYTGYYMPVGQGYFGLKEQLNRDYVLKGLKPYLESDKIKKYGHDIKTVIWQLGRNNIRLSGIYFDSMVASYLLNPGKVNYDIENIAIEYLNLKMIPSTDLLGRGKKQVSIEQVPVESVSKYSCARSDVVFRLSEILMPLLKEKKIDRLMFGVEMPLLKILADMEQTGIKIDREYLIKLSNEFDKKLTDLTRDIYKLAGQEFNINSPKQLGFILFEKHRLPVIKKTKTGYSTDEEVLKKLSSTSELTAKILEYRESQKLKSTYIDAMLDLSDFKTSRIHTSFNQAVTATGRLSSSEPNLQNIPIKTELGREIRRAFVCEDGFIFVSADYSQIDLRVLAHVSRDKNLCEAFNNSEDVHTQTACELFVLEPDKITPDLRRIAKTINFGVIYGMSAYGLSQQLNISPESAQKYIDSYFEKYSGVKEWSEGNLQKARQDRYVGTLLNRIRYLPEINSQNKQMRAFAERTAINTVIQGSAADIIKIAMINIDKKLKYKFKTKLLIQVHDDLLFEVPECEKNEIIPIIKYEMENAFSLIVPLVADIKTGKNWRDMVM